MSQINAEKYVAKFAAIGASLVSVLVLTGNVSDPVNAPKLFLLGATAVGLLTMTYRKNSFASQNTLAKLLNIFLLLFVTWAFVSSFVSVSPFSQNLYGVYGRNTGLLTYSFLSIWAFVLSRLSTHSSISRVMNAFVTVGFINILYCAWVLLFGDFVSWNNPYKAILGTFGNPNFISSFLGMFLTVIAAYCLGSNKKRRIAYLLLMPVITWELYNADSLQGIVVSIVGVWIVVCYWLFATVSKRIYSYILFFSGLIIGTMGLFGSLGFGPLTKLVAQPTVALREQYWYAAYKMGIGNPVFGVGLDSYGDWYRRMRGAKALITPGPNTVTNVAHNVYLDILAYGGFPLLFSYIAIFALGAISILKVLRGKHEFDYLFISVTALWVTYNLQSLISINQIGLALWGWISTGLLVAYSGITSASLREKSGKIPKAGLEYLGPGIRGFIGFVLGALIAVPPLSADIKWTTALKNQNVESLENSLAGDYLTPLNSMRLAQAAQTLERSGIHDLAIKYARLGVKFNPNYDDAWETLYYMRDATLAEKKKSREQLIYLDPLNPEWKKLA